jgi:Raf kinase inhibitor-like YbhB/YbcL family protein
MRFTTTAFSELEAIPAEYAFGKTDARTHVSLSENLNPDFAWNDVPVGTRSFVLLCHDPDVPSKGDDVNREGKIVPANLPRVDFFHWVLVDLPSTMTKIACGEFSNGVTPRGKAGPQAAHFARQGINDYTGWFASDADMAGNYFGYDGPCPPWNDELAHRYVFTVVALDIARLPVEGRFGGADVRRAMQSHVLAQASITGRYALNPAVKIV